jgi:hypothetical protein
MKSSAVCDGQRAMGGVVAVDGAWFGGHVRPRNPRVARIGRRRREHQSRKRRRVGVMPQRSGPTVPVVVTRRPRRSR